MPKQKILVVEDEALLAEQLKYSLDADRYEVSVAESGERAVHESVVNQPDLVLLDIVLPGLADGISVAEQFVSLDIPVIYMTGYPDGHLFDRARHTEPVAFLQKPLRIPELRRVVELALSNRVRYVERERQRALQENLLRESEERFRRLVEGLTEYAIFTLDAQGNVNSWNSGAKRVTGYSSDEVLGRPFNLFFTAEDRARNVPEQELEQARRNGSADDSRWLVRRNGERYWVEGVLHATSSQDGRITAFTKISRDTTERRTLEEALHEREERLRIALNAARTGTWRWDLRTNIDIIDESLQKLFGLAPEQTVQTIHDFYSIVHPDERAQVMSAFERTLKDGIHLDTEFRVVWPDGSEHWLLDQGEVERDGDGKPIYLSGACVDITDRKQASQALQESERRFRFYTANVRDYALLQLDREGRIVEWNAGAERVLGYPEAEILGQSVAVLFTPEDVATGEPEEELERASQTGRSIDERWHLRRDGTRFWASGVLTSMTDDRGRLQGFAKVMRDETDRRRAEEQMRASLQEKEVLLQEIHHRVKNNLQVITSLLRLQSEHISDEQTLAVFDEARNRVQAIGGIHELLYESSDLARVDFGEYLKRLTEDLVSFYGIDEERLHFDIHVTNANFEISQAVPCGLLVNELVTNTLKHAFPGQRQGTLRVSLHCAGKNCVLVVEDDGAGLPEGFDWKNANSLGLQLVQVLTTQLDGVIQFERLNPGSRFEVSFPVLTAEAAA